MKCFRETSACGGAVPALSVSLACALGVLGTEGADTSWNFEAGLTGWTQTGTAFQFQPTYGNNAAIRYPGLDLHLEGNYWIGTYENRPASWAPLGQIQGDGPTGTLLSTDFTIEASKRYLSFMIGGGLDAGRERVELLIREDIPVTYGPFGLGGPVTTTRGVYHVGFWATGRNTEVMHREIWDCQRYLGQTGCIRIVDQGSGSWGHVNCDDFRFTPNPVGDLWITGLEVTQGIQDYPGNGIPLIGGKQTLVRVYAGARSDDRGAWNNVTARLTTRRTGSVRTHIPIISNGSLAQSVPDTGSDRAQLGSSFSFLLDYDETVLGDVTLEARIYCISDRAESDFTNNYLTNRFHFNAAFEIRVVGYAYGNTNNPPVGLCLGAAPNLYRQPFDAFYPQRDYAENVYPVAAIHLEEFPGTLRQWFDNHGCHAYDAARHWLAGQLDRLYPHGGVRGFALQPEANGYYGLCCDNGAGLGNRVASGQSVSVDPGPTFAHEIGHSYDRLHTFEDHSYPRTDGSIGSTVGLRFSPQLQTVVGQSASGNPLYFDFMSYSPPFWVSPYTYCGLMWAISGHTLGCPSGIPQFVSKATQRAGAPSSPLAGITEHFAATQTGAGTTTGSTTFLYVAGTVSSGGSNMFEPFELIRSADDLSTPTQGTTYFLTLEDAKGLSLVSQAFDLVDYGDNNSDTSLRFSFFLPWQPTTVRIVLYDQNQNVLAKRLVSANSPTVQWLWPKGGEMLAGQKSLFWQAEDLDGDALTYSVYYSPDGGGRWLPLDQGLTEPKVDVDFDAVPGSTNALLRVVASDGVLTGEAQTQRAVLVPRKSPSVSILGTEGLSTNQTPPVVLRAVAFDWEDGTLTDPSAFAWYSDASGFLGAGPWINLSQLPAGPHTISVIVQDSDQNPAVATVAVTVPKATPLQPDVIPFLLVNYDQGQAQIAWPSSARQYLLEETDSLASPAIWKPVGATVLDEDPQLSVSVPVSSQTKFYRLRLP